MNLKATTVSSDTITVVTGSATTVDVQASWLDAGSKTPHGQYGNLDTAITTAATTTIVPRPEPYLARVVKTIAIRNKGSASNVTTVVHNGVNAAGTAVSVEVYKVTLAAGDVLMYDERNGWSVVSANSIGVVNTIVLAANVANSANNVAADVTGLTFALVADATYEIKAVIPYTSAATTTGSRWMLNGPAITALSGTSNYTIDATSRTVNNFVAYDIPAAANATSLTAGNIAIIEATLKPSAAGTLAVRFASEVDTSAITALAGATLTVKRVI